MNVTLTLLLFLLQALGDNSGAAGNAAPLKRDT